MKIELFRSKILEVIKKWESNQFSNLEFYKASISLFKEFRKSSSENPVRTNDEPMKAFRLLLMQHYFESLPIEFYDKSYIPFFKEIFLIDKKISREEMKVLKRKFIPNESFTERSLRLKNDPFYKPFADLLESIDLTKKIKNLKEFGWAVSSTVSYSTYATYNIQHPSGTISWIDTLLFNESSSENSKFSGRGICYGGLTSGGLELNIPFTIDLNFKSQEVLFLLGDFFDNSSEARKKLTGKENVYFKVNLAPEKFFRSLRLRNYDFLAKELASEI